MQPSLSPRLYFSFCLDLCFSHDCSAAGNSACLNMRGTWPSVGTHAHIHTKMPNTHTHTRAPPGVSVHHLCWWGGVHLYIYICKYTNILFYNWYLLPRQKQRKSPSTLHLSTDVSPLVLTWQTLKMKTLLVSDLLQLFALTSCRIWKRRGKLWRAVSLCICIHMVTHSHCFSGLLQHTGLDTKQWLGF